MFTNSFHVNSQVINPVKDLPLEISKTKGSLDVLVLYITGDGGWNDFNQQITQQFEKQGYGIIALNSRKYFWDEQSPQVFANDVEHLCNYYLKEWGKSSLIIVGYSFGADVSIFLPRLLSANLQQKIARMVLISPSASTDFEIKLSDMVGETENVTRKYKVEPEIANNKLQLICTFGDSEQLILKSKLKNTKNITTRILPGDHRYNNNFNLLLKTIVQ
jgi:type IV secretory pathway VirJ component